MSDQRHYYKSQDLPSQRLTRDEEREMFRLFVQDRMNPRLREKVVRAYVGFALQQALKDVCHRSRSARAKAGLSEDDAISAANYGLMRAIDRYDPEVGVRFTAYAGWWIKKALHDAKYSAHAISVPRKDRQRFVLFRRQTASGLTPEQIAELNNIDVPEVERVLGLASGRQDPIEMFELGGTMPIKAHGDADHEPSPADLLDRSELLEKLQQAKARLGLQELRMLHYRFVDGMPLADIAKREKISCRSAASKLRCMLSVLKLHLSH